MQNLTENKMTENKNFFCVHKKGIEILLKLVKIDLVPIGKDLANNPRMNAQAATNKSCAKLPSRKSRNILPLELDYKRPQMLLFPQLAFQN